MDEGKNARSLTVTTTKTTTETNSIGASADAPAPARSANRIIHLNLKRPGRHIQNVLVAIPKRQPTKPGKPA